MLAELGGIDVLVNNAGINGDEALVDMSLATWRQMIDVNLTSMFLCTRAVLPTMIAQRSGRIINMGSQLALIGGNRHGALHGGEGAACTADEGAGARARAAQDQRQRDRPRADRDAAARRDLRRVAGPEAQRDAFATRFGRVEEIAPTAVLLASDGGSFYTGSTLNVSGGDVMY